MTIQEKKKTVVSIIIVHYKAKEELYNCLDSIITSKPKYSYEIIVIDNDEIKNIADEIIYKYPHITYKYFGNKGFGVGNNIGANIASGEFLFFLNPDTKIFPGTIDIIVEYLKQNNDVGIAAPLLHDMKGYPYQQGAMELTPLRALICLSFINKWFPNNPVSKKYFLYDWDKKTVKEVAVVPGTAFVIGKNLFREVGGFDENFFLYFEEFDLCNRVRALGWKLVINPHAKVYHVWGASSKLNKDAGKIFLKSRYYYFKKYYGSFSAKIISLFLNKGKRLY